MVRERNVYRCAFAVITLLSFMRFAQAELGLWTSKAELATIAMSGPAWDALITGANQPQTNPDVANQDDNTNVYVLASAIVYARTGDLSDRNKVVNALEILVGRGNPGGRTLAWARETGAYALAADLVDYRTSAFEDWLRKMAEVWVGTDGRTLMQMRKERPNNWGTHAVGALCAIYAYLQDNIRLVEVRNYVLQAITGPNPGLVYGDDLSWHLDPTYPRIINPLGAVKNGMVIDGVLPDDLRRGGSFKEPPAYTGYVWEAMQGLLMGARILERLQMPIWLEADSALYRAAYCFQVRFATLYGTEWQATGDDAWMLPFLDKAYKTLWSNSQDRLWGDGKNVGWGYVTLAGPAAPSTPTTYTLTANTFGSGSVVLDPNGGVYEKGTTVGLSASPATGWNFVNWVGDLSGSQNPATIVMDGDRNVTAYFSQPVTVSLNPTDDTYIQGGSSASRNFNSDSFLRVKNGSGDKNDRHTYLRFDLSSIAGVVSSATLQLTLKALTNGGPTAAFVYSATNDNWTETTLTWKNAPPMVSLLTSRSDLATAGAVYTFDVTAFVASQVSGDKIVTLVLKDDSQATKAADFYRREDASPPVLVVQTK